MSAKETHFDVRADSTGAQAKLRNQRGPWLEITAATCVFIAITARLQWINLEYTMLYAVPKLAMFFVFLQVFLILIRRRRRSMVFTDLNKTRYGVYPGPAPISFPVINGWKLAILARLQNSLIGDWIISPIMMKAMHIDCIRRAVINMQQTHYPVGSVSQNDEIEEDVKFKTLDQMPYSKQFSDIEEGTFLPITIMDYTSAYKNGKVTPINVAEKIIENIYEINPKLNIICDFDEELIRQQASASSQRYREGCPIGPLDGVPCVVKDQVKVKGLRMRDGLPFKNQASIDDAEIIRRLKDQGCIIIGISNMVQMGLGCFGNNPSQYHGECRNPFDTDYYTCGSSSGTAAAIASGLVPIGIGSDGGGSIRLPASTCSLFGLKPSCGRVSTDGSSVAGSNAVLGPMARTTADLALLYSAISGQNCPQQPRVEIPNKLTLTLEGKRIGVDVFWSKQSEPSVYKAFCKSVDILKSHGAMIVEFRMPDLNYMNTAHLISFISEISQRSVEHICNGKNISLDNAVYINAVLAGVKSADYIMANKIRTKIMKQVKNIFQQFDYIITPTSGTGPTLISPKDHTCGVVNITESLKHTLYTKLANFTGIPAISVPNEANNSLPIGIQIMSSWWSEKQLLEISALLENEYTYKKPQIYVENF